MLGNLFSFQSKNKEGSKKKGKGKTEEEQKVVSDAKEEEQKVVSDTKEKQVRVETVEKPSEEKKKLESPVDAQRFLELAKKIETLQQEAQRRNEMWTSFNREKADLENELQRLHVDNENLRKKQKSLQEDHSDAASLQSALAAERRSNADLSEKLRLEQLKVARLDDDLKAFSANSSEETEERLIAILGEKVVLVADHLNSLAAEADLMSVKLTKANNNVDSETLAHLSRTWTQASHTIRSRADEILKRIDAVQKAIKENHNSTVSVEESKTLTALLERTQQRLDSERSRASELEARMEEMRSQMDALPILRAQVDIYRSDFDAERAAREKIAGEKSDLEEELRRLKSNDNTN